MSFKFLPHTADIKVEVLSFDSLEKAFEDASMALKQAIVGDINIKEKTKKVFAIEAEDNLTILYDFLEEFIYLLDAEDFLLSKVRVKIRGKTRLEVEVWGDKASNYEFSNDVKAITYNQMSIEKEKDKYKLVFVLDV